MQSVMKHNFSTVPKADIQRSSFDRSHGHKTTFDAGYLVPILVDEALPGDTFNCNMTAFARLASPIYPVMDNMFLDSFYFAVPYRLIWNNWKKFNGEQDNPGDTTDYLIPTTTADAVTGHTAGSLSDHFGIPTEVASLEHNVLFHRAYNLIWNEWFRDENLQDSETVNKDDGPDTITDANTLLRRGKRHDYFTSCLPWPQKNDSEVPLPLGTKAPIMGLGKVDQSYTAGPHTMYETGQTSTTSFASGQAIDNSGDTFRVYVEEDPDNSGYPGIYADLSAATAATINQLREAFQIQKLYERDARGGTRYNEVIQSHFGVSAPDFRLQRSEYLGGGSTPLQINQVPATGSAANAGILGAYGVVSGNSGFTKSFVEHSLVFCLVSLRADLTYQQGLNRMFSRQTRWDHFWPALANIGEQEVLNKEIYCDGSANDELVFGYQERYSEMRYFPSLITGQFRSNYATPLDAWHLCQDFGSLPTLNSTFIEDNPPIDRIIRTPSEPHLIFDSYFKYICARPMPTFAVPGLIDHF